MLTSTNSKKTAKWRTIARLLLQRIHEQLLTPGDKLPPERELAEQLGVSRTSVREALRALTILNVLDFGMPIKEAVTAPRIHHQWKPNDLRVESQISQDTRASLKRRGHRVKESRSIGTVQGVLVREGAISGQVDPRRNKKPRKRKEK